MSFLGPLAMGLSAVSNIFGAKSASDAANENAALNAQISEENLEFQEDSRDLYYQLEQDLVRALAASGGAYRSGIRGQLEDRQGTTDALGNRTEYVPGVGWVSTLAPQQQGIQDRIEDQIGFELGEGERIRRGAVRDANEDRLQRGQVSDKLINEFQNVQRRSPEGAAQQAFAQGEIGRSVLMHR